MNKSKQPRKQRKALYSAPAHRRHRQLRAHLSNTLFEKYGKRSARVAKGDTVKIMRGDDTGHENKVQSVMLDAGVIYVDGATVVKSDGSEVPRPLHTSNVTITKLNLEDKVREARFSR